MLTRDVDGMQRAVRLWPVPRSLSAAEVEEWRLLVHSRIMRPDTADVLQQAADEEWWVLPDMRAVLQLRLRDAIPKIHGLVVRTPRQGDGRQLVAIVIPFGRCHNICIKYAYTHICIHCIIYMTDKNPERGIDVLRRS